MACRLPICDKRNLKTKPPRITPGGFAIGAAFANAFMRRFDLLHSTDRYTLTRLIIEVCIIVGYRIADPRAIDDHERVNNSLGAIAGDIFYQSFVHLTDCPVIRHLIPRFGNIVVSAKGYLTSSLGV